MFLPAGIGADLARLVDFLVERADGNPLYSTEILRALENDRFLRQSPPDAPVHMLGSLDDASLPVFIRQLIEVRIAGLGDEQRRLLQLAAVIGEVVPLELWGQVADVGDELLIDSIEQAMARGIVAEGHAGRGTRFSHAVVRESIYASIAPIRRRAWHLRVAEALESETPGAPDAVGSCSLPTGRLSFDGGLVHRRRRILPG